MKNNPVREDQGYGPHHEYVPKKHFPVGEVVRIIHNDGNYYRVRRDIAEQLEVDGKCRIAGAP